MSGDKANKGTFPAFKKLALGILLTVGANAIFLTISFTVREYPVCAGELVLSKGILQVRSCFIVIVQNSIQGWSEKGVLGCVFPPSLLPLAVWASSQNLGTIFLNSPVPGQ